MQKKINSFNLFLGWALLQMCILNAYHNQNENECAKLYKKTKCKKIQIFKTQKHVIHVKSLLQEMKNSRTICLEVFKFFY